MYLLLTMYSTHNSIILDMEREKNAPETWYILEKIICVPIPKLSNLHIFMLTNPYALTLCSPPPPTPSSPPHLSRIFFRYHGQAKHGQAALLEATPTTAMNKVSKSTLYVSHHPRLSPFPAPLCWILFLTRYLSTLHSSQLQVKTSAGKMTRNESSSEFSCEGLSAYLKHNELHVHRNPIVMKHACLSLIYQ